MRVLALLVCLSVSSPMARGDSELPEIEQMMPLLADLAARGSYGVRDTEAAAFIVRAGDGQLECLLWPSTGQFQRTSINATIPTGLVAIAHTHPRCCKQVSQHDRREAVRLSVPVVAISMGTLSAAVQTGELVRPQSGISWRSHQDPARRCTEPDSNE